MGLTLTVFYLLTVVVYQAVLVLAFREAYEECESELEERVTIGRTILVGVLGFIPVVNFVLLGGVIIIVIRDKNIHK